MNPLPLVRPSKESRGLKPYVYTAEIIPAVWDEMEAMLERAFKYNYGMLSKAAIFNWLVDGSATAFATTRDNRLIMVLVVMKVDYAHYSAARIIACAGRELQGAMQFIDALEAWALTQGCVEIEAWCRPAMVRLTRRLGWLPKLTMVSRDLRRKLQ